MDDTPDPASPRGPVLPRPQGPTDSRAVTWRERFAGLAALVSDLPPEGSGVYFLERSGVIVYVGSSEYPSKRVFTHDRCQGKDFDAVWFLPVDESERIATERHWIRTLTPCHNKAWNPCPDPDSPGWGADPDAEGITISVRCDPDLIESLDAFIASHRVKPRRTRVIVVALSELLKAEGFYPPKPRR